MWNSLYKKLSQEYKLVQAYVPSGSGRNQSYTSSWGYYDALTFLIEHLEHCPQLSSVDFENSKKKAHNSVNNKGNNFQRKISPKNEISKLLGVSEDCKDFLPVIADGIMGVLESKRFDCVSDILSYIADFIDSIDYISE